MYAMDIPAMRIKHLNVPSNCIARSLLKINPIKLLASVTARWGYPLILWTPFRDFVELLYSVYLLIAPFQNTIWHHRTAFFEIQNTEVVMTEASPVCNPAAF